MLQSIDIYITSNNINMTVKYKYYNKKKGYVWEGKENWGRRRQCFYCVHYLLF